MSIVFFGSSKYSAIGEEIIHSNLGISLVVTLPNRELGRRKELTPNPVAQFAKEHSIPTIKTEKLTREIIEEIRKIEPDFLIAEDFGLILPKSLLQLPKYAPLNIHHSLLPKYRGVAPVPFAILACEKIVGVSIIEMNEKVDAGDILAQEKYELKSTDTTESVLTTLNRIGATILLPVIKKYLEHNVTRTPQNETKATFTKIMSKQDGYINTENPPTAEQLDRMIRAYYPWPGVWTKTRIKNQEVRIKLLPDKKLQVEGKNPMSVKDFLNGYPSGLELLEKLHLI